MQRLKTYIKPVVIFLIMIFFYLSILILLHYTGLLKLSTISKINLSIMSIATLFMGIVQGKKTSKRGYLEGLKMGSIIVIILFILNLICYRAINLNLFIYYLILLASTTIGSMIGINLKR